MDDSEKMERGKQMRDSEKKGLSFVLAAAAISGISVFVNSIGVRGYDPFAYTVFKNLFAGLFIVASIAFIGKLGDFRKLTFHQLRWLALITILGGSVPFLMFFYGLSLVGGPAGSFLYRLLFVFSAAMAAVALKEKFSWKFAAGAAVAIAGNFILLGGKPLAFGLGESLVLGATLLWSLEWVVTKRILTEIPGHVIATSRMFAGSVAMMIILFAFGKAEALFSADSGVLAWSVLVGALLFLFLSCWYAGLSRISVTKATAVLTLGGPITTLLGVALAGQALSFQTALGMLFVAAGAAFIAGYSELLAGAVHAVTMAAHALRKPVETIQKWKEHGRR